MRDTLNTVLGPKKVSELGKTLIHEHLLIGWPGWEGDSVFPFDRKEAIKICCGVLEKLKGLGVKTFGDPCPSDLGRDPEFMAECAQKTGMNVVCATGYYKEDLGGSSFTITSLGKLGGLFATPIVNYPEVAILGVHEMKRRPVVRGEQIVVGEVMLLSLSFDHRIIDGHVGAAFAQEIIGYLEEPDRLLIEMS